MKLREIFATIREYPNLQQELINSQFQVEQLQRGCKELKRQNIELDDACAFQEEELSALRSQREAYTAALKTIGPIIESGKDVKLLYECVAPCLDREGFTLYRVAEGITGFKLSNAFPYEDCCGRFVMSDGNELIRYLEAYQFGGVSWEIVPGTTYERGVLKEISRNSPEFQAYEKQLYTEVMRTLGFESLLPEESAQSQTDRQSKGKRKVLSPQEEMVGSMMMPA